MNNKTGIWVSERFDAKNLRSAILSRIKFHVGINVTDLADRFGSCNQTVLKHLAKAITDGLVSVNNDFTHVQATEKLLKDSTID
jgi:predicted ArsR family transcriptional regulator